MKLFLVVLFIFLLSCSNSVELKQRIEPDSIIKGTATLTTSVATFDSTGHVMTIEYVNMTTFTEKEDPRLCVKAIEYHKALPIYNTAVFMINPSQKLKYEFVDERIK